MDIRGKFFIISTIILFNSCASTKIKNKYSELANFSGNELSVLFGVKNLTQSSRYQKDYFKNYTLSFKGENTVYIVNPNEDSTATLVDSNNKTKVRYYISIDSSSRIGKIEYYAKKLGISSVYFNPQDSSSILYFSDAFLLKANKPKGEKVNKITSNIHMGVPMVFYRINDTLYFHKKKRKDIW